MVLCHRCWPIRRRVTWALRAPSGVARREVARFRVFFGWGGYRLVGGKTYRKPYQKPYQLPHLIEKTSWFSWEKKLEICGSYMMIICVSLHHDLRVLQTLGWPSKCVELPDPIESRYTDTWGPEPQVANWQTPHDYGIARMWEFYIGDIWWYFPYKPLFCCLKPMFFLLLYRPVVAAFCRFSDLHFLVDLSLRNEIT